MTISRIRRITPLFVLLTIGACSQAATTGAGTATPPAARDDADIEALYRARLDSARMRFTEADVHFMTGMIHHHAQAIEMGNLVASHTDDPSIHILAARIINAQKDEIATMQRWLRDRDQPVPEVHVMDTGVMVHGSEHSMHMPGMLTPEQIRELGAARGTAFDRLFLTFMIQHHRGAVSMVRDLFAVDGAGQDEEVFKFASDVQADQSTEVARMELMLSALPGGDRSP